MEDIYGLNFPVRSFAVANGFVQQANKVCYKLGGMLKPFGFYTDGREGVMDFAVFAGLANSGVTIADEVAGYRSGIYKGTGIFLDTGNPLTKRYLLYDYLMTIAMCYVEIPKYITKNGVSQKSFDKFFCTRNPAIMAAWMGCQPIEMQAKYSPRVQLNQVNFADRTLKLVKLNATAKGNTIAVPRSLYCSDDMACVPVFMLHAFMDGIKQVMENGVVEFNYLKDNGTERKLVSTLNSDILMDFYSDTAFVGTMLALCDIDTVDQGGMKLGSKMNRGYVKIPELGASRYDGTGVRSLNIARLLSAKLIEPSDVDKTYIDVDLNSVVQSFNDGVEYMLTHGQGGDLAHVYVSLSGEPCPVEGDAAVVGVLESYVSGRSTVLSTTFHRSLHMFMVSHPEWFPLYTGKPVSGVVKTDTNLGVQPMDF